jgi:hypothetical protein
MSVVARVNLDDLPRLILNEAGEFVILNYMMFRKMLGVGAIVKRYQTCIREIYKYYCRDIKKEKKNGS